MEKKLIAVLVDVENEKAQQVVITDSLDEFYTLLKCDTIDIVSRQIGKHHFDIICDDEGLCKGSPKISAIDNYGRPQLVGNLLIVGMPDENGNLTSLTEREALYILDRVEHLCTNFYPDGYPMLTQVTY